MKKKSKGSNCRIFGYAAYIPCYEGGNAVRAVTKDAQIKIFDKSMKSLVRNLLRESSVDTGWLRENMLDASGKIKIMPIPISLDTVLVPVKMRKALCQNDGSYGYVDLSQIKEVLGDKDAVVILKSGFEISCTESAKAVKNRMWLSDSIREKFVYRMMGDNSLKEGIKRIGQEYGEAATKGDIVILAYEILKLVDRMDRKIEDFTVL